MTHSQLDMDVVHYNILVKMALLARQLFKEYLDHLELYTDILHIIIVEEFVTLVIFPNWLIVRDIQCKCSYLVKINYIDNYISILL